MGGRTPPRSGQVSGFKQFLLGTPSPLLTMVAAMALSMQSAALRRSDFAPKPTAPRWRRQRTRTGRPGHLIRRAFNSSKVTHDDDVPLIHLSRAAKARRVLSQALGAAA